MEKIHETLVLLERIDKLKQIMPCYVLELPIKLAVPYSLRANISKEYDQFSAGFECKFKYW